ncbi:ATP-binding protein [Bradyrhizobium sp. HKCCYLR20261]|uniref:ATP-binding protein n=1 Tax=Bradyrhizobium sp. HKCCYLR20261 TaxID=3420760 RepID=UPI003EB81072
MVSNGHPIEVDLERILPLLAREIYTSPFAFLRENVQNAVDAIRMQRYRERRQKRRFRHSITIEVVGNRLSITDTGIGMTRDDLSNFFWSIGKSGKHTEEAKTAGVVGTFGIGGMANFGVCSRLEVVTRTRADGRAVLSYAERSRLSAKENCVFYEQGPADAEPGTTVTGTLIESISFDQIFSYLEPIVKYLDVPISIGDRSLGQSEFPTVERDDQGQTWEVEHGPAKATVWIRALQNGQAEIEVESFKWEEQETDVSAVFSTTRNVISAYQHGFMLANVPITTVFGLGGMINSSVLRPTAGREAVTDESRRLVQALVHAVERGLAEHISRTAGLPERFSSFYRYLSQTGLWELAGATSVRVYGSSQRRRLDSFKSENPGKLYFAREGHDQSIVQAFSEQGKTVVLLSSDGQRQKVESNYLQGYCKASLLADRVTCLKIVNRLSIPEEVFKYQLLDRLRTQYLVEGLHVKAGQLTHGAMLWPTSNPEGGKILFVDFRHPQIRRLVELRDSYSFDAVFDIFIRDSIFPSLESFFPDLRRRDFDALLRRLQSTVEYFEIDPADIGRIQQLASITKMAPEKVALVFGRRSSGTPRPTSVGAADVIPVPSQINDVAQETEGRSLEDRKREFEIRLLETSLDAKILDAREVSPDLGLARYYLALTSDAHVLYRRIFLERKPSADFSWGGYRGGYLFYSEGSAVVYYDIQFEHLVVENNERERTGKVTLEHTALVLENQVFLPIPQEFESELVPRERPLKFTIRHQILGVRDD